MAARGTSGPYEMYSQRQMNDLAQKANRLECALRDAHAQIEASIPHCEEWRAVELTKLLSRIDRVLEPT